MSRTLEPATTAPAARAAAPSRASVPAPAPLAPGLAARLRAVVGNDGVITDPAALLVYESDGLTAYRVPPRAVVLPRGTAQVAAVVRLLAEADVPFVPRGAGTGLSGGALALEGAVVVSLTRMNRILSLEPADRRARVEPGVVNARLSRAAAPHGLYYAPDPSSQSACTIGGNVAENAGGPHCLKYGVTSNHITGLTVVLPDGEVVVLGGAGGEAAGYDLVGLFVGSEGTFGIATEIEVRLSPLPEAVETLLALFDRVDDASRAVSAIIAGGLLPAALEMMDGETIRAVEDSIYAAGIPRDTGAALVIECDGARAGLAAEAERAIEICTREGAREVRRATDEAERQKLWQGRKKAFGAMGRLAPDLLVQDAVVPRSRLPEVLAAIYGIAARHRLRISNVFHAGDGNLHPNILFDRRDADELARVEAASREIMRHCVEVGGTITGEHGVGLDKRGYMELIFGDAEMEAMCAVRRVFNPRGLANPSKVLPIRICREWAGPGTRVVGVEGAGAGAAAAASSSAPTGAGTAGNGSERRTAAAIETRNPGPTRSAIGAPDLATRLAAILPADAIRTGDATARWAVHGVAPMAVVAPETVEQAAAVLARASGEGWAVALAGAGTRLDAGDCSGPVDLVISTARLRGITAYEPADLVASLGAGTPLGELPDAFAQHRQWLPLDPPAPAGSTLGAAVATAAAGPLRRGHGTPRDHVLGLQLVTGDGRILELGGRVVKNVAGYDLVKLVIGSRGTLGLVTRVNVRLRPLPETDVSVAVTAREPGPLLDAVARVGDARLEAAALELVSPATLPAPAGGDGWVLLARLQGSDAAVADATARLESVAAAAGARSRRLTDADARRTWTRLAEREAGAPLAVRLADRPSRLDETLARARRLAGAETAGAGVIAHAGDGIVRVFGPLPADDDRAPDAGRWAAALAEERAALRARGGTLVIARGPAALAARLAPHDEPTPTLRLMQGLKQVFDPAGILAPVPHHA